MADFWRERSKFPCAAPPELLQAVTSPQALDAWGEEVEKTIAPAADLAVTIAWRVEARVEPRTWRAFYDTEIEGLSIEDVAQALGVKRGVVYNARRKVKRMLEEEGAQARQSVVY
jgi:RNA polymerase sigma-70 factor (ECF subfamily)